MYDNIILLIQLAKYQSFKQTAHNLNLPLTTVNRKISELENFLGVNLIIRSTKGVKLTTHGELVYQKFSKHEAYLEDLLSALNSGKEMSYGIVKISLPLTLSDILINNYIANFCNEFDNLRLDITYQSISYQPEVEYFDLMLSAMLPKSLNQKIKRLHSKKVYFACTDEYQEKFGLPKQLSDLKNHNLICLTPKSCTYCESYNDGNFINDIAYLNPNIIINSLHRAVDIGLSGNHIFVCYKEHIQKYNLIPIFADYDLISVNYYLIRGERNSKIVDMLANFLENIVSTLDGPLQVLSQS